MKIRLDNPNDVNEFVSICDAFGEFGVDVHYGSHSADGRSTVGMLNFMGHDVDVKIHAGYDETADFEMQIEKFEVD